jgi:hypothetical protein
MPIRNDHIALGTEMQLEAVTAVQHRVPAEEHASILEGGLDSHPRLYGVKEVRKRQWSGIAKA